jgi:hypothetical protein
MSLRSLLRYCLPLVLFSLLAAGPCELVLGYSAGPPDGYTGAPGEGTCQACHEHGAGSGAFTIEGPPPVYQPGATYALTVHISQPGQARWGFELTALDSGNKAAGEFLIVEPTMTQLSDNPGAAPDYVKHTAMGTMPFAPEMAWTVNWIAPDPAVGDVTFYAAGNAANNNNAPTGDYIYTTSLTVSGSGGGATPTPTSAAGTPTPTAGPATGTPTPSAASPTPAPASPTPGSGGLTIAMEMPATFYRPGMTFSLDAVITNGGTNSQTGPLFVILEVFGTYYFYPSWTHEGIDYSTETFAPGENPLTIIPAFTWPDTGQTSVSGLVFYGAVVLPDLSDLWSNLAVLEWGYGP